MPWKPEHPGEVPTLGWYALDWMTELLAAPDRQDYEPFYPTLEQAEFILGYYELNPRTCKRVVRRGVISRPRGWGKSPFVAALCILEALGDVVPDGWDADGRPVGKPWSTVRTPLVQLAAVSEKQTDNAWRPLLEMLREDAPVFDEYPGLEPLDTFVNLPSPKGKIEPATASAATIKGAPAVFAALDQTEEWTRTNGGVRLFRAMRNNAAKIGGSIIETPNAFVPGDGSVAENTANAWTAMVEGRSKLERGLLYDHREAPPETDMEDRESLTLGLRIAYGDSSDDPRGCLLHDPPCAPGWSPIEEHIQAIWEPDSDPQLSRGDFLNQITHASDSWLSAPEWRARADVNRIVADKDTVTLGFDGSRRRRRGVTDATALVGCRVEDGHVFEIQVWEQPKNVKDWQVPQAAVDLAVRAAFQRYNVVGFYADPAKWESYVADWEAAFGRRLKVKATQTNPVEWWMTGGRRAMSSRAIEQFENAVIDGEMTHAGTDALNRHVLNARRRPSTAGMQLGKEHPDSDKKIDAAIAAVLAWAARVDALALGLGKPKTSRVPTRIR